LSEFSTITISLKEKKKPGILGYIGLYWDWYLSFCEMAVCQELKARRE
jgi:hypothetical protein